MLSIHARNTFSQPCDRFTDSSSLQHSRLTVIFDDRTNNHRAHTRAARVDFSSSPRSPRNVSRNALKIHRSRYTFEEHGRGGWQRSVVPGVERKERERFAARTAWAGWPDWLTGCLSVIVRGRFRTDTRCSSAKKGAGETAASGCSPWDIKSQRSRGNHGERYDTSLLPLTPTRTPGRSCKLVVPAGTVRTATLNATFPRVSETRTTLFATADSFIRIRATVYDRKVFPDARKCFPSNRATRIGVP